MIKDDDYEEVGLVGTDPVLEMLLCIMPYSDTLDDEQVERAVEYLVHKYI